jgi:hypothetical protein
LINILNPKLSIFFLAFLPQFVAANGDDLAAPRLRRRLCRARGKIGVCGTLGDLEIKKAGSRPAVFAELLNLVAGARAERGSTRARRLLLGLLGLLCLLRLFRLLRFLSHSILF